MVSSCSSGTKKGLRARAKTARWVLSARTGVSVRPIAVSPSRMREACSATVCELRCRTARRGTRVGNRQFGGRTLSTATTGLRYSAIHAATFRNSPAFWFWVSKQRITMSAVTSSSRACSSRSRRDIVRPQPSMPGVSTRRQCAQLTGSTVVVQSDSPGEIACPSPCRSASIRLLLPVPVRPNRTMLKLSVPSSCRWASSVSSRVSSASRVRSASRTRCVSSPPSAASDGVVACSDPASVRSSSAVASASLRLPAMASATAERREGRPSAANSVRSAAASRSTRARSLPNPSSPEPILDSGTVPSTASRWMRSSSSIGGMPPSSPPVGKWSYGHWVIGNLRRPRRSAAPSAGRSAARAGAPPGSAPGPLDRRSPAG